jgi:hypothetical protein
MKPGTVMIDMAYYMKRFLVANQQRKYFLCGVDCLTSRLFCVPCVSKNGEAWEKAILQMVEENSGIAHLISDRDGAVVSKAFRKRIKAVHGITWSFLMSRSHAFRSEIMIKFLKRSITQSLRFNPKGDNCWTKNVSGILKAYNSRVIPGTTRPRDSVTKHNYMEMLEELRGSTDPTMLFNISTSTNYSPWLKSKLWNFKENDRVLVAREADYKAKGQQTTKGGSFFKRSVEGSWSPVVRRVTQLWLKDSRFFLTPVYRVSGISSLLYETELIPALWNSQGGEGEEKEEEEGDEEEEEEEETEEEKNAAHAEQGLRRSQRLRV